MRLNQVQLSRLESILVDAEPGLVFPFLHLSGRLGIKGYDPEDLRKDLGIVRRRLRRLGRSYMVSGESIWRSD